jgi:hypothetical protein
MHFAVERQSVSHGGGSRRMARNSFRSVRSDLDGDFVMAMETTWMPACFTAVDRRGKQILATA